MIAIDKGVPMPKKRTGAKTEAKYPWADMEVGDSFVYPGSQSNAGSAAHAATKRFDAKFSTRAVEGGTRIWRIA